MSYSSGEALILTRVQACTGFSTTNAVRANWKLLNQGKSDHYAIVRPGPFRGEMISPTVIMWRYTTVVELWQRYKDDATTQTSLYGYMAYLTTGLMPYRKLGDTGNTISDSIPRSTGQVQEMWTKRGGPSWLKWELTIEWQEEEQVTYLG